MSGSIRVPPRIKRTAHGSRGESVMEIVKSLIERNKKDIEQIGKFVKKLDKLNSKELAGKIQSLLIEEVIRLGNQNKELEGFLEHEGGKAWRDILKKRLIRR